MRPLRYSINVTLDGCCDHRAITPDEEVHRHAAESLDRADALLLGRVTYEMMEAGWRRTAPGGARPDRMEPFARAIDAAKKYVVSSTLHRVDWNAELVRGDLAEAVRQLKREPGKGLLVGGVKLPLALAELGLIDEYEFFVQPWLAGHGPTLFAGLSKHIDLKLVGRQEFASGRWRCGTSREGSHWACQIPEIAQMGFTYTMRNAGSWQIVVAALHDPVANADRSTRCRISFQPVRAPSPHPTRPAAS